MLSSRAGDAYRNRAPVALTPFPGVGIESGLKNLRLGGSLLSLGSELEAPHIVYRLRCARPDRGCMVSRCGIAGLGTARAIPDDGRAKRDDVAAVGPGEPRSECSDNSTDGRIDVLSGSTFAGTIGHGATSPSEHRSGI
jgi:hypothetical protein